MIDKELSDSIQAEMAERVGEGEILFKQYDTSKGGFLAIGESVSFNAMANLIVSLADSMAFDITKQTGQDMVANDVLMNIIDAMLDKYEGE